MREVKIVKIGGSVITYKDRPYTVDYDSLANVARQLSKYVRDIGKPLIIIHGGGSFGHAAVKECGNKDSLDPLCASKVINAMMRLDSIFCDELIKLGLAVTPLPPHAVFYEVKDVKHPKGILKYDLSLIKYYIGVGVNPVLFGDVITVLSMDLSHSTFRVLSGDEIAWILAKELGIKEIIFVTRVGGLYTSDPHTSSSASLIRSISKSQLSEVVFAKPQGYDVTGGMEFKIRMGLELGIEGVKVKIVGYEGDNLYNSLVGLDFRGTTIWY